MTAFRFSPVTPHQLLKPYIAKMWVFESSGRLPESDRKLIVPNANFKLAFTCYNGLTARVGEKTFIQKDNEITFTGLVDAPVMLDPQKDTLTKTIVIEFNPIAAYRLFRVSYAEIKNQIVSLEDLIGKSAAELQQQLAETTALDLKLQRLQNFLIQRLEKTDCDRIYDYCITRIMDTKGLISVTQLEKETGYSSRWLHKKFSENLGTGPKNFAEIIRFKQFYELYSSGVHLQNLRAHVDHNYYDQSHFLRAFKRFTGAKPSDLKNSMNELAIKHYTS